jgi:ETC complex I subunit conserved region
MFLRSILRGGTGAMLMAAGKVKTTTGIVGLEVVPNAREVLIDLYNKTLKEIEAVPSDEGYRKAVESFTKNRLQICQQEKDWEQIEKKIGCGQVEELIEEAQDELKLIAKLVGTSLFYGSPPSSVILFSCLIEVLVARFRTKCVCDDQLLLMVIYTVSLWLTKLMVE